MARPDCTEWARTINQIAMNVAASQGPKATLESVADEMVKTIDAPLSLNNIAAAITEATEQDGRNEDAITAAVNSVKRSARTLVGLTKKIAVFEETLRKGEILTPAKQAERLSNTAVTQARAIRDDLARALRLSEPAQKKRIQDGIDKMDALIASGDFAPRVRPAATPTSKALERLEFERDQKRKTINRKIADLKPRTIWTKTFDVLNIPQAIMTSVDWSAVLRQGGFVVFSKPLLAAKSLAPMFSATFSPQRAAEFFNALQARPNAPLYAATRLAILDEGTPLSKKEEAFQTTLAQKIPGLGAVIRASERGYITFLNQLRADSFDAMAATLTRDGEVTLAEAKGIANFINSATGRGPLGGFENSALAMNALFFSARNLVSRFQLVGGALTLGRGFNAPARVRKEIRVQYARYLFGLTMFYSLASLAFEDDDNDFALTFDPRNSDFGKLRFGNTRVDPLSGMGQGIVVMSRLFVTGQSVQASTGNVKALRGDEVGFGGRDAVEVGGVFLRNKFSPLLGSTLNLLAGSTAFSDDPVTFKGELTGLLLPMTFEEVAETIVEQGVPRGTAISLLAIFGMSIQTWGTAFNTMSRKELREQLRKHTYKETKRITRDGQKILVKRGQAHIGQEGRVTAIREELGRP